MAGRNENMRKAETLPKGLNGSFTAAVIVVLVIAALYIGRDIFIPLALAILLSFMLTPPVAWMQRQGVPKVLAVAGVVTVVLMAIFLFGSVMAGRLTQLAENIPTYQSNIQLKIRELRRDGGPDRIIRPVSEALQEIGDEVTRPADTGGAVGNAPPGAPAQQAADRPIPVEIAEPTLTAREMVETVVGPLIAPLAMLGITIIFVIFILVNRHDLRDRFIRLASFGDITRATQALEDASSRVAKYLLTLVLVNLTYGIPLGIGLWLIGVPNPLLWGTLAVILRFIPYAGPILAAIFPIVLSIAADPGWTMLMWTLSLVITLELISNNVLEPWLYGARTGLSPIAIIVSAVFWTWLWGPIGLLLATPLSVCLFVLGRHVPQLTFFEVLLGNERVLTYEERLRQRLLALDSDEATEIAEEYLREHTLEEFYDKVAIPALVLIERDRVRGALYETHRNLVADGVLVMIDNLLDANAVSTMTSEIDEIGGTREIKTNSEAQRFPERSDMRVICIGAQGGLDDAAAAILAQCAVRRGIAAKALSRSEAGSGPADLAGTDIDGTKMMCLLYLSEGAIAPARYLVRRLHRRMPGIPILAAFLSLSTDKPAMDDALKAIKSDLVSTSLADTLDQISGVWKEGAKAEPVQKNTMMPGQIAAGA